MKLLKIILIVVLIFFFLGVSSQWRFFIQPFSKQCGYSSFDSVSKDPIVSKQMSCDCRGFAFSEFTKGPTTYNNCFGSCTACECSYYYSQNNSRKIVDCANFSHVDTALVNN